MSVIKARTIAEGMNEKAVHSRLNPVNLFSHSANIVNATDITPPTTYALYCSFPVATLSYKSSSNTLWLLATNKNENTAKRMAQNAITTLFAFKEICGGDG